MRMFRVDLGRLGEPQVHMQLLRNRLSQPRDSLPRPAAMQSAGSSNADDFDELWLQAIIAVLLSCVQTLGPWLGRQAAAFTSAVFATITFVRASAPASS